MSVTPQTIVCCSHLDKKSDSKCKTFTLLFAVQMKLTVDPTLTVCALGSSTVTSMALDGTGETHATHLDLLQNKMCHFTVNSQRAGTRM